MGYISQFNLENIISEYKITTFLETGTWLGDGLSYAANFGFNELYSIELLDSNYKHCLDRFNGNDKIKLIHNNSIDGIKQLGIDLKGKNCLYWLDAHLPDFYDSSFTKKYSENEKLSVPLELEIKTLQSIKDISNDVFIMDDLRIYEVNDYESGNWTEYINQNDSGIKFIYELLSDTHEISKDYRNEGYIIALPKK